MGKNESTAKNVVELETKQTVKHRLKTQLDHQNFYRAWNAGNTHAEAVANLQEDFQGISPKDASTLASQVRKTLAKSLIKHGIANGMQEDSDELKQFVAKRNVKKFRSAPVDLDDFAASLI